MTANTKVSSIRGNAPSGFNSLIKNKRSQNDKNLIRLIPEQFKMNIDSGSAYERVLCAIDYVSGMTDIYAVELYKKINGISIGLS